MAKSVTRVRMIGGSESDEAPELTDLNDFVFKKVLSYSNTTKSIYLEGTIGENPDPILLILEKEPFDEKEVKLLLSGEGKEEKKFQNDIYSFFKVAPATICNRIKITAIYPANENHIHKYTNHAIHLINETPELYETITLPYVNTETFSLQWVYNILDHKAETGRIIFEDSDSDVGFVLLPDLKWDERTIESLHLLAFPFKRGILSIRDLTEKELPLLKNINEKCLKVIEEKFSVPQSRILGFFHYQPSFYHLHVHFKFIQPNELEGKMEKCHPIYTVINNITLMPNYYQTATLLFSLKETDDLFKKYEAAGLIERV